MIPIKKVNKKGSKSNPLDASISGKGNFIKQNYVIIGLVLFIGIFAFQSSISDFIGNSSSSKKYIQNEIASPTQEVTRARVLANPQPKRNTCPEGFYYYENGAYSLCYPDTLTAYIDNYVDPTTGEIDTGIIDIEDEQAKAHLRILPSFTAVGGLDTCITRENVTVSGLTAVRETKKENIGSDCGKVMSVATKIQTDKSSVFWIIYQAYSGGDLRFLMQYPVIERSLVIK